MAEAENKKETADQAVEKKENNKEVDTSSLSSNAKKVLEMVEKMTIVELNDLVKVLEEKFGVSAAPIASAGFPAGGEAASPGKEAEEKSQYDVELTEMGANKIAVIKALREINQNLGLREAKELAESAPKVVLEEAKKEEAEAAKSKLEEAGAKVTLK